MDITVQYFDGCPNWKIADERLMLLAAERPDIVVTRQRVDTVNEAERVGLPVAAGHTTEKGRRMNAGMAFRASSGLTAHTVAPDPRTRHRYDDLGEDIEFRDGSCAGGYSCTD